MIKCAQFLVLALAESLLNRTKSYGNKKHQQPILIKYSANGIFVKTVIITEH